MCREDEDTTPRGILYEYQNAGVAGGAVRMNIKRRELELSAFAARKTVVWASADAQLSKSEKNASQSHPNTNTVL